MRERDAPGEHLDQSSNVPMVPPVVAIQRRPLPAVSVAAIIGEPDAESSAGRPASGVIGDGESVSHGRRAGFLTHGDADDHGARTEDAAADDLTLAPLTA